MRKKYLKSADWQIGMKPENKVELQDDYTQAASWIMQRAREEENCAGIILDGDIRDTKSIEPNQFSLISILAQGGGKPVGILMGNHDETTPNWVETLAQNTSYVKNIATDQGVLEMGLDPSTCQGFDYLLPQKFEEELTKALAQGKRNFFIHQSIGEFGASIYADITTVRIQQIVDELKITDKINIFAGDVHNYGDYSTKNVTSYSPGSIQATDINEGFKKLQSHQHKHEAKDYRKFILWWYPDTGEVEREEIPDHILRPWYYDHFMNGTERIADLFSILMEEWKGRKPGRVVVKVPTHEVSATQELAQELQKTNGFPFDKFSILSLPQKGETEENAFEFKETNIVDRKAWVRSGILELAKNDTKLDQDAIDLLKEITEQNGSTKISIEHAYKCWEENKNNT